LNTQERATHHAAKAGTRRLFIYYRVNSTQLHAAIDAATRLQAALRARHPGLEAQLMRRADAADSNATLMEIYAIDALASPAGIQAGLRLDIEQQASAALAALIVGPRHVEEFDACA
jgi:Domain of unknown function (DUF4936)